MTDRCSGQEFDEGVETGARSRCPSTTTTPTVRRSSCSSPAGWPTTRRTRSARCSSTPAGRASAAATSPSSPSRSTAQQLLERFDIVGWDPRGTGSSEPAIDCIDDYDRYFAGIDITPDDDAETPGDHRPGRGVRRRVRDEERRASSRTSAPTTRPATWTRSVRRSARTQISYFGFSYGSELGATWATLFPETVRAAVLDGAADPNADPLEGEPPAGRGASRPR